MPEKARQRKSKVSGVRSRGQLIQKTKTSKGSKWSNGKLAGMAVGLAVVAFLAVFGFYNPDSGLHRNVARFLDSVTSRESVGDDNVGSPVYAVMMDAGSTGSRILVFTFSKSPSDGRLKLKDEFYKEVKPGISSYTPAKAADSIRGLFEDAKRIIPEEMWSVTPAALKATAGLRLLPGQMAEQILEAIREVFDTSGFLTHSKSVEIIDGTSEGLYCWTTINFLLNKLGSNLSDTVAVFDLGGGSMQLALAPLEDSTISVATPGDIITVQMIGRPVQFYIHSYLGLGLMAVRLAVLQRTNLMTNQNELEFISPFFGDAAKVNWEFQGKKFTIQGSSQPLASSEENQDLSTFISCRASISNIIADSGVRQISELQHRDLFAISYFFDRAVEASLIEQSKGGFVGVQDVCLSARNACELPDSNQPFACIDLTYICTLLEDGFGLAYDQVLNMKKKIDGHETSWALGAALSDLDQQSKNAE